MRCPRMLPGLLAALLLVGGCAPNPHLDTATDPATADAPSTPGINPDPGDAVPLDEETDPEAESEDEEQQPDTEGEPEPLPSPTVSVPPAHLSPGDEGDGVRDLQHRLQQLSWYEGRIDGIYGDQTRLAVQGFQAKRGLPVVDFCDERTWQTLVDMSRQPTRDEMYNVLKPGPALLKRGATGEKVKDLQARLTQLQWYSAGVDGVYGRATEAAVRGFQEKRQIPVTGEVDQRTLDRLVSMSRKPTPEELGRVTAAPTASPTGTPDETKPAPSKTPEKKQDQTFRPDDRCLTGRVVCISKKQRTLAWVVDGAVRDTMAVRFGSELTPTRNGRFSVYWKSRDHVSKLYKTPMPYALFFSGGQAVHYSRDFARRGYNGASHGCVNVRDKQAVARLFDAVREGDTVIVF